MLSVDLKENRAFNPKHHSSKAVSNNLGFISKNIIKPQETNNIEISVIDTNF